jgi:NAD(P)-dependent dehydrogenase (short-subunit alcohol dehydrogenase family)
MKTALVTGCSSGFGLKIAVTLARNGFRTFATMRDLSKRAALDAALAAANVTAEVLALDVTDKASIDAAVATVLAQAGQIDALVNNAGYAMAGFVEDISLDEYRRQMETNFFGVVAVTKAVLPHMRERRSGAIVHLSSLSGRAANPVISAYAASKFAVEGFSESLALEASLFDVFVVLVEPGFFKTEIVGPNRQLSAGTRDPRSPYAEISQDFEKTVDKMVEQLAGDPQKVADTVLHILTVAKPQLRYLVGTDARLMATVHRYLGFRAYATLVGRVLGLQQLRAKLRAS